MLDKIKAFFDNTPDELVEYLYIDENRLSSYSEQLLSDTKNAKEATIKFGWSATGPTIGAEGSLSVRQTNSHERISKLVNFLEKRGLLLKSRPSGPVDFERDGKMFFLENFKANKLIFNIPKNFEKHGVKELAVWISNPVEKPPLRTAENYSTPIGVFLYLIESYWEADANQTKMMSGNSALLSLLDYLSNKYGLNMDVLRGVTIGRGGDLPPMKILEKAGLTLQSSRTITALYRIRNYSDDQYVNIAGISQRCFDLFAYPIFISL
jgi:hypothetical protein